MEHGDQGREESDGASHAVEDTGRSGPPHSRIPVGRGFPRGCVGSQRFAMNR